MPTNFRPVYTITPTIAKHLMSIEMAKEKVSLLPLNSTFCNKTARNRYLMDERQEACTLL